MPNLLLLLVVHVQDNPTQSEVSTYLHYMGSENLRSRDLNPKEGVEGAMRVRASTVS